MVDRVIHNPNAANLGQGGDEPERYRRVMELSAEQPDARPALLRALADSSWRVRKGALQMVRHFANQPNLPFELINGLADAENAGLRTASALALISLGEIAVPALSAAASSDDGDLRKFIVEVLGEIGGAGAQAVLLAALDDADENVCSSAAEALGRIGDEPSVSELTRRLNSCAPDGHMAAHYINGLLVAKARLPFENVMTWLGAPGLERFVLGLLGLTADVRAVELLVQRLASSSRKLRCVTALSAARLCNALSEAERGTLRQALNGCAAARKGLLEAAREPADDIARSAVEMLALLGDASLAPSILDVTAERTFVELGVATVVALGPVAVEPLLQSFDGLGLEARVVALEVLDKIASEAQVQFFLEKAHDSELRLAEAAIGALGRWADSSVLAPLMALLSVADGALAKHVALSLAAIGQRQPDQVADAMACALRGKQYSPHWLFVLGLIRRPNDIELVLACLGHSDGDMRRAAIEAAMAFGGLVDEELFVFALADEQPAVREAAARALATFFTHSAGRALLVATGDASPRVVAAAIESLGHMPHEDALAAIVKSVTAKSSPVAIAALRSLRRKQPPNLRDILLVAMAHDDSEVVRETLALTTQLHVSEASQLQLQCLSHRSWHVRKASAELLLSSGAPMDKASLRELCARESEPLVHDVLDQLWHRVVG